MGQRNTSGTKAAKKFYFLKCLKCSKMLFGFLLQKCHLCQGKGNNPCTTCAGSGKRVCTLCNGSGYCQSDESCTNCNGCGRKNCSSCSGSGSCQCDTCHGKGKLLVFINLNVKRSTEKDEFIAQDLSGLRVEQLGKVSGKELFKDAQYMVYPVMGFPDVSVAQASERLVRDHQVKSRILQQISENPKGKRL